MKHIGMDVHSTTTDVCVRNGRGVIIQRSKIRTTKTELKTLLLKIAGPKRVALEESQNADWVTRVLAPEVDEVIRSLPQHNKLICGSEDKYDRRDAESLSELLYLNRLKAVHHPPMAYRTLREAVRAYWVASRELTRAKNRLKGWYQFNGLFKPGKGIYSTRNRNRQLEELEAEGPNIELARLLFDRMDYCRRLKASHTAVMRKAAKPVQDSVRLLMTMPAIGPVTAYTIVGFLEEGYRIPNKRKLWRYAGLSLRQHESNDKGYKTASKTGNHLLKGVVMSAATTVVSRGERNALLDFWERDIRQNVNPKRARRNLARKIIVIAQHLLRSRQEYDDELIRI
jgi:transposase